MKKTKIIFLVAGLLILYFLFRAFGLEKIVQHFSEMGWRFGYIVGIHLFSNIGLAYALRLFIKQPFSGREFVKLVFARIAGGATSSINGVGAFAGEPLKAMYIKDFVPFNSGLAAVVMDRTVHSISVIFIFLTGIIVGLFMLDIPLYVSLLSLTWILFVLFLMIILLKKQRDGFMEFLIGKIPKKLREKIMTEKRWETVKELDYEISALLSRENRGKFCLSLGLHYFLILIISTVEIFLIVRFIADVPGFTPLYAMFVYIFGFILTSAMFFMPANVGTSEGSYSLALMMLGFDPALGLSIGIIRRFRSFTWAGIGVPFIFYAGLLRKDGDKKKE